MKSLTDGEVLKQIRKKRGLNQEECCQGIISRHTYSKIERNQTSLQFHVLLELLERLSVSYSDFLFFKKGNDTLDLYRKRLSYLNNENIHEDNPLEFFTTLKNNKDKSIQDFHYYLLCKKSVEKLDFDQIGKLDAHDLNYLNVYITNLTFFSILDLALISDMCDYLNHNTIKKICIKIIKQINELLDDSIITQTYQQTIHQSLYAITTVVLNNEEYELAKLLLEQTKEFLNRFPNHYFLMLLHFNTHTLNYKLTQNNYYLSKLFTLKDYMKELEDYDSVEKIENQIKQLIQQTASIPENIVI